MKRKLLILAVIASSITGLIAFLTYNYHQFLQANYIWRTKPDNPGVPFFWVSAAITAICFIASWLVEDKK